MNNYQLESSNQVPIFGALANSPTLIGYLLRSMQGKSDEETSDNQQNQGINEILEKQKGIGEENQETVTNDVGEEENSMLRNTAGAVGLGLGSIGSALKDRGKYRYYARG